MCVCFRWSFICCMHYHYYCYHYYFTHLRLVHTSVSWCFSIGVWMTARLNKCPGLFSVFRPILTMQSFEWSSLVPFFWVFHSLYQSFLTVTSEPNTNGMSIAYMFHRFFSSLARSRYLSLFLLSFSFTPWSAGTAKSTIRQVHFFCCLSLRLAEIRWSVCISKYQRILYTAFF